MKKEMKKQELAQQNAGYASPSIFVLEIKTHQAFLQASQPTDMDEQFAL